ncbi:MAG: rRNA maturation RNase YbeY [Dehalococcoidia bacterium]|nr:rRNA maturation RNase YbeY [Dehalococcoidia bacterium]
MPQPLVGVEIDPKFHDHINEEWVRALAGRVLEQEGPQGPAELGILITGDEEVRELNRLYRGLDQTTDVLSFALTEGDGFVTPPDGISHLGEVIISYPQAERQAQERGQESLQEIALLLVHGILHLLGHDHADPDQERHMRATERALLQAIPDSIVV